MSVKTEIDRIRSEVSKQADLMEQIKSALEAKGVEVPGEAGATMGRMKRWTYTLAQDSTTDVTMVVGDPWIQQNYNNPKLSVLITPSDTVGSGVSRPLGATFRTNYKITEMTNGTSYGMGTEASASGQKPRAQSHLFPLTEMPSGGNTAFGPFVNSNGDIIYYNGIGTGVTICAGDYDIIAWI